MGFPSVERFKEESEACYIGYNTEKIDIASQKDKLLEERSIMEQGRWLAITLIGKDGMACPTR